MTSPTASQQIADDVTPRRISYAEWQSMVRHGYASTRDGQLFVLALDKLTQATILEPVVVDMIPANQQSAIFRDHNCWKCRDGTKPCAQGHPHRCEYPHAKND